MRVLCMYFDVLIIEPIFEVRILLKAYDFWISINNNFMMINRDSNQHVSDQVCDV